MTSATTSTGATGRIGPRRVGLVLGAGGAVGHAFHAGVLAGMFDATGWDARGAEVVVGTSAGSIIGALLRAGVAPADLAARATGGPLSSDGRRLLARADAARGGPARVPSRPARTGFPTMSSPRALARGMLQPWAVRPGALAAAALPEGRVPTEFVAAGLRPLFDGWPARSLWINAVALSTSRRETFGREGSIETDVATAVAASCAIPGFFAPVVIDGVRYIDGGVHSPTNADLVAGLGLDLVVISSPMSIAHGGVRVARDQAPRRLARLALVREAGRIRRRGTPVLTFQPTDVDLAVMGWNAMDASRAAAVASRVRQTARQRLERREAEPRVEVLRASARRP